MKQQHQSAQITVLNNQNTSMQNPTFHNWYQNTMGILSTDMKVTKQLDEVLP